MVYAFNCWLMVDAKTKIAPAIAAAIAVAILSSIIVQHNKEDATITAFAANIKLYKKRKKKSTTKQKK